MQAVEVIRKIAPAVHAVSRLSRGQRARTFGALLGIALLAAGLWGSLSALDLGSIAGALGIAGFLGGIGLGIVTQVLGAMAWSVIVSAVAPSVRFRDSMIAFFTALPLKYLPGSVWNHVGKATWLTQTPSLARKTTTGLVGASALTVGLEFLLLLWSGLIATLLVGVVQVPRGVAALVDQARWNTWFVMSLFVALLIPVIVFRLSKQLTSRAMPAFAARIWCAELLQVAGWLCGSALLGYLVAAVGGAPHVAPDLSDSMLALYSGMTAGLAALFVPNGIGVREWVIALAYSGSVSSAAAFNSGMLFRALVMFGELGMFLFITVGKRVYRNQNEFLTQKGD